MELHPELERLALDLRQRRGTNPVILFLGNGVAHAAGVPSSAEMARKMFPLLSMQKASSVIPDADDDTLVQTFYEQLNSMPSLARHSMLQRFYSRIPVPRFYQDAASLINDGFFQRIITTNIDTLLSEALNNCGLRRGVDYRVIIPGSDYKSSIYSSSESGGETHIKILKLHGDLAENRVAITPQEIDDILLPQRRMIKSELMGDIVMVGYQFESEPLNDWLRRTSGTLWWINRKRPTSEEMKSIEGAHPVNYVDGPSATPEQFFTLLTMLIANLPSFSERDEALSLESLPGSVSKSPLPTFSYMSTSGDELTEQYLRDCIRKSQSKLMQLEQHVVVYGEPKAQIAIQMDYERRQLSSFEDQLRELTHESTEVIELVKEVANAVRQASNEPGVIAFLDILVDTLKTEYGRPDPSHDVIGTALGSILLLVERLKPGIVDEKLISKLSSIAPSTIKRGV